MSASAPESFHSILWPDSANEPATLEESIPDCFHDLNLDQMVSSVTATWSEDNLAPFFYTPVQDVRTIVYRQAVFEDLGSSALQQALRSFVEAMRATRVHLAARNKLDHTPEKDRAHLRATSTYLEAIETLAQKLDQLQPQAPGLQAFGNHLHGYTASKGFTETRAANGVCTNALDEIRYKLIFHGDSVTVRPSENETAAGKGINALFAKFRPEGAKHHSAEPPLRPPVGLNDIEAQVLDRVVLLHPETFAELSRFRAQFKDFIDPCIARFAREIAFYLAWLEFTAPLRAADLPFCLPTVETESKAIEAQDAFDIMLAIQQNRGSRHVVCNSFALSAQERIIVVSGPNQGGKTTFARMFGQLHWLAALGCSVPAAHARLYLFDHLFTHFEQQEDPTKGHGKLQDELIRLHAILTQATPRSVLVFNEIFSSTTFNDALWLGQRVMTRVAQLDVLGVCVTFLIEFTDLDAHSVSMVAQVKPDDPTIRTFKIERQSPDGLAYALAVAEKHRVTRDWLLQRIAP